MKYNLLRAVSFILSLILIYYLLSFIDIELFWKHLKRVDKRYYLMAFGLYACGYCIRSLRILILFPSQRFTTIYIYGAVYQLLLRILPFRTGELFFPILLKKIFDTNYGDGMAKLFFLRMMDVISLLFILVISSFFLKEKLDSVVLTLIITSLFVILFTLIYLRRLINIFRSKKIITISKFRQKVNDQINNLDNYLSIPKYKYVSIFLLSILDKIINFSVIYVILLGLNIKFPLIEFTMAYLMAGFTSIIPISSIGSFGTTELGWAGALIYLGTARDLAISSGFSFNILSFTYTLILGLIGYIILNQYYKINIFKIWKKE